MNVALFNDTSTARHFGCDVVMEILREAIRIRGAQVGYAHPTGKDWRSDATALRAIEAASVVIVNGEGSIHHSRPSGRWLAALGPYCAKRGRPAFLINATIEANDRNTISDLLAFKGIYVRETTSLRELETYGGRATVVGDLSFGFDLPRWTGATSGVVVVDSTRREATRQLAGIAWRLQAEFVSMKYADGVAFDRKRWSRGYSQRRRKHVPGIDSFVGFASYLATHRHLVTGRYHALCFAINMGMPFSVMPSNTAKCQALIFDVGLNPDRVFSGPHVPQMLPLSEVERAAMAAHSRATRERQAGMFDHILAAN